MDDGTTGKTASVLAAAMAEATQVRAVALGGSRAIGTADGSSDIDLSIYTTSELPVTFREALAVGRGRRVEIDNCFWETGDEWDDTDSGSHVDIMYRDSDWIEDRIAGVLDRHEAGLGYSTCVWHNVLTSKALHDPTGWFAGLQARARRPYPDGLVRAFVARNHPVLRDVAGSYRGQIVKAATRGDPVSVNHRTAAFLASYFDVLFAINRVPHPGEKRLLELANALPHRPAFLAEGVGALLAAASADEAASAVDSLCDQLDDIVGRQP